jgi:hypothetical protein
MLSFLAASPLTAPLFPPLMSFLHLLLSSPLPILTGNVSFPCLRVKIMIVSDAAVSLLQNEWA